MFLYEEFAHQNGRYHAVKQSAVSVSTTLILPLVFSTAKSLLITQYMIFGMR